VIAFLTLWCAIVFGPSDGRAQSACPAPLPAGTLCFPFPAYTNAAPPVTTPASTDRTPYVQGSVTHFIGPWAVNDVRQWGAVGDGVTDDSGHIQACLSAQPPGGCFAGGKRYFIGSGVQIPAGSTLDCGYGMGDLGSHTSTQSNLNIYPALLLTPGSGEITASGPSARVKGCLILNKNLTFPVADSSGFAGIAVADNGNASFNVVDSEILGFDTTIWITGNRPYLQHLILDGTGISKAALEIDVGNTDSGIADDVKIQTGQSAPFSCPNGERPGTGVRVAGTPIGAAGIFMNNIVSQPFQTADYEFDNSVIAQNIWADGAGIACGFGSSIGVLINNPGATVQIDTLTAGDMNVPLAVKNGLLIVNQIYAELAGSDGIEVGTNSTAGQIYATQVQIVSVGRVSGYGVNLENVNSRFSANQATILSANGSAAPYVANTSGSNMYMGGSGNKQNLVYIGNLRTDLSVTTSPYSTNLFAGTGSDPMLAGLKPSPGPICSDVGSGGTCALDSSNSDQNAGTLVITAGSGALAAGEFDLAMPVSFASGQACVAALQVGTGVWDRLAGFTVVGPLSGNVVAFDWSNNSVNLTPGETYKFAYNCRPL